MHACNMQKSREGSIRMYTDEELDDLIDKWHNGAGKGKQLYEFLGWTWAEYKRWVERGIKPE